MSLKTKFRWGALGAAALGALLFLSACAENPGGQYAGPAETPSVTQKEAVQVKLKNSLKRTTLISAEEEKNEIYRIIDVQFGADKDKHLISAEVKVKSVGGTETIRLAGKLRENGSATLMDVTPRVNPRTTNHDHRLNAEAYCDDLPECEHIILNIWYKVDGQLVKRQYVSEAMDKTTEPEVMPGAKKEPKPAPVQPVEEDEPEDLDEEGNVVESEPDVVWGEFVGSPRNEDFVEQLWDRPVTPEAVPEPVVEAPPSLPGEVPLETPMLDGEVTRTGQIPVPTKRPMTEKEEKAEYVAIAKAAARAREEQARERALNAAAEKAAEVIAERLEQAKIKEEAAKKAKADADAAFKLAQENKRKEEAAARQKAAAEKAKADKDKEDAAKVAAEAARLKQVRDQEEAARQAKIKADAEFKAAQEAKAKDEAAKKMAEEEAARIKKENEEKAKQREAQAAAEREQRAKAQAAEQERRKAEADKAAADKRAEEQAQAAADKERAEEKRKAEEAAAKKSAEERRADADTRMKEVESKLSPFLDLRDGGRASYFYSTSRFNGKLKDGAIANSSALPMSGKGFARIHKNRTAFYGTGMMISLITNLAAEFVTKYFPGSNLYLGDLSEKGGGRLVGTRHKSHQNGLDADISYIGNSTFKTILNGRQIRSDFQYSKNWQFWRLVASQQIVQDNKRVSVLTQIYVNHSVKRGLCAWAKKNNLLANPFDAELMRRIRNWDGHDKHFHLRIKCSPYYPACRNQGDPAAGTGC